MSSRTAWALPICLGSLAALSSCDSAPEGLPQTSNAVYGPTNAEATVSEDLLASCVGSYVDSRNSLTNFSLRDLLEELRRSWADVTIEKGDGRSAFIVRAKRFDRLRRENHEAAWEFVEGRESMTLGFNTHQCNRDSSTYRVARSVYFENGIQMPFGAKTLMTIVEESERADEAKAARSASLSARNELEQSDPVNMGPNEADEMLESPIEPTEEPTE